MDFTGRTVISPDPNCAIDQVIVPRDMAKTLTFPQKVTDRNMSQLKEVIVNGSHNYPGANTVLTSVDKYG